MSSLSYIVPIYNESQTIVKSLKSLDELISISFSEYEIIIIDDGSTDNSIDLIKNLNLRNTKFLINKKNMGQGYSLHLGFKEAQKEIIVHNGIDEPISHSRLVELALNLRSDSDICVVERKNYRAYGLFRKMISSINNHLIFRLSNSKRARDLSFVQIFRNKALKKTLSDNFLSPSFFIASLVLSGERQGLNVDYIFEEYQKRKSGKSNMVNIGNLLAGFTDILKWKKR